MYKQQKPLTISSGLWALVVTVIVLLLAASANAQTGVDNGDTAVSPNKNTDLMPKRNQVEPAREVRPASGAPDAPNRIQNLTPRSAMPDGIILETADRAGLMERAAIMQEKRATLEQKTTERRSLLEARREAIASSTVVRKAALERQAQERLRNMSLRVANQLTTAITKLQEVSDRLKSRANELKARGVETAVVDSLIKEIETSLEAAKLSLEGVDVNIEYTVTSERPVQNWAETRAQFQEVHEMIKTVRSLLRDALAELKQAVQNSNEGPGVSAAVRSDVATTSTQ